MQIRKGHVVQFLEKHKWCGCFGFVDSIKDVDGDEKVMIGVPIPSNAEEGYANVAYIYSMLSNEEFEIVGDALLVPGDVDE